MKKITTVISVELHNAILKIDISKLSVNQIISVLDLKKDLKEKYEKAMEIQSELLKSYGMKSNQEIKTFVDYHEKSKEIHEKLIKINTLEIDSKTGIPKELLIESAKETASIFDLELLIENL